MKNKCYRHGIAWEEILNYHKNYIDKLGEKNKELIAIVKLYINQCELIGEHNQLYYDAKEALLKAEGIE